MDWLAGTMEDALRYVAERGLAAQLVKRADVENSINQAQNARQELGILGANEEGLNAALGGLQSGRLTPSQASRSMAKTLPGVGSQLSQVPAGVGTAISQGRPTDALAQADVLGLKNAIPGTENFDPTTAMMSASMGVSTLAAQHQLRENQLYNDVLHGTGPATGKMDVLAGQPGINKKQLQLWRAQNVPPENSLKAVAHGMGGPSIGEGARQGMQGQKGFRKFLGGLKGGLGAAKDKAVGGLSAAGGEARRRFLGPPGSTPMPMGPKARMAGAVPKVISRDTIANAANNAELRGRLGSVSRVGRAALPLAAASLPLLYREWLGHGYRSGHKPIQDLVEANQTLAQR